MQLKNDKIANMRAIKCVNRLQIYKVFANKSYILLTLYFLYGHDYSES